MGFVSTKTQEYPYLRRVMGLSAVDTVIKYYNLVTWVVKLCKPDQRGSL
jgi:hypothetical protein